MKKQIGKRLKQLRVEKGLTQKELAAGIAGGIDYTYIGKIERGEQLPSLKILLKICEALAVPAGAFFQDDAVVPLADARVQSLLKRGKLNGLMAAVRDLPEDDLPLVEEIVRLFARHGKTCRYESDLPLAAEEPPGYGSK